MTVRICFKIPGEDVTAEVSTIRELVRIVKGFTLSCVSGIYLNNRKIHFGGTRCLERS
jgi:hypothetical protein